MSTTNKSNPDKAKESKSVVKAFDTREFPLDYFIEGDGNEGVKTFDPTLKAASRTGKGEFYLKSDCFTRKDDKGLVIFYPKHKCVEILDRVFFKSMYVVQFQRKDHAPEIQDYVKSHHIATYTKQEYYEFFAMDSQGNKQKVKEKDRFGKLTGNASEKEAPIKGGFVFSDVRILNNPDNPEKNEKPFSE